MLPNIQSLLSAASASRTLAPTLHDAAVVYLGASVVPYPVVRDLWIELTPVYGVPFHRVLAGSSVILESPKAREKSEELKARLSKLQDLADQKVYNELVRDVTRHSRDTDQVYFSSYRDQFGFGLHVMLIMFTGYIFGYTIFRSQFKDNPALHAAGGVIGLIAGMFVEIILFIVRASLAEETSTNSPSKVKTRTGRVL